MVVLIDIYHFLVYEEMSLYIGVNQLVQSVTPANIINVGLLSV